MRKSKLVMLVILVAAAVVLTGCANKWKTSGKIAMGQKNWEKALSDFELALLLTPKDGEIHYLIAHCYKEMGDYPAMVPHLNSADSLYKKGDKKIMELRESTWQQLFDSGNTNTNNENFEKAKEEFETAIKILPGNYAAYINLGYVLQNLGDNEAAYTNFAKAHEMEPENMKVLENFASLCFNLEKYDEAAAIYRIILEKDPQHAEALIRLGMISAVNESYDEAIGYYNKALEFEAERANCDIWFNLGILYFRHMNRPEDAIEAFSRAVEFCPEDANAHINLNVVLMSLEKFDEAVANLESFTLEFPDDCIGWDLYSQALLRKGLRSQALDAQKKFEECKGQ